MERMIEPFVPWFRYSILPYGSLATVTVVSVLVFLFLILVLFARQNWKAGLMIVIVLVAWVAGIFYMALYIRTYEPEPVLFPGIDIEEGEA